MASLVFSHYLKSRCDVFYTPFTRGSWLLELVQL